MWVRPYRLPKMPNRPPILIPNGLFGIYPCFFLPILGSESIENLNLNFFLMAEVTYCTQQDIEDRKGSEKLARLAGDPSGQTIDAARVSSAIEEFAADINAAVRKRYPDLPFDATHKLLNGLNIQGAWLLLVRDGDRGWTDDDRDEWKMLLQQLKDIATGLIDLRSDTEEQEEEAAKGFFSSNRRLFGRNRGLRPYV